MKLALALLAFVALASAHVRFEPANHASRSSNTFSVATGGCGAADVYNSANAITVTAGDLIDTDFNYGTGTNGDHADGGNTFQGYWLCDSDTANLAAANILASASALGSSVDSPGGSTPGGYDMSFTVPISASGTCTYSVRDQRNWADCLDYNVIALEVGTVSTATANDTTSAASSVAASVAVVGVAAAVAF